MKRRLFLKSITAVIAASLLSALQMPIASAETEILLGDVTLDGMINTADVAAMQNYIHAREAFSEQQLANADCAPDGVVNGFDLAVLKRMARPMKSDVILEEKGTIHSGFATFYGGGYEGGCAMLDPISKEDYWITAMNLADYNNAQLAGAYLEVTGELGTIHVLVTDLLPEGAKGDLDLYVDAFPLIAPAEKGKVPVTWKIIPLDSAEDAPVSYKYKTGSSAFWCGVQVRNHRYPIAKLEYLDASGEFVEIQRRNYNYFESDSMGAGPFTFRITDIYGSVIVDENIPFTPDEIQQGHVQFPK